MADILASIKRIVAEEDRRGRNHVPAFADSNGEVFELTPEMRLDADEVERDNALASEAVDATTPSIDEAAVADIARVVIREELNGPLGIAMTQNIKKLIREEVQRALAARD
jgi:cell pole-organizing protein PopZ